MIDDELVKILLQRCGIILMKGDAAKNEWMISRVRAGFVHKE